MPGIRVPVKIVAIFSIRSFQEIELKAMMFLAMFCLMEKKTYHDEF